MTETSMHGARAVWPNPSFNHRSVATGGVSLACGTFGTFACEAYAARLRGRG